MRRLTTQVDYFPVDAKHTQRPLVGLQKRYRRWAMADYLALQHERPLRGSSVRRILESSAVDTISLILFAKRADCFAPNDGVLLEQPYQ